MAEAEVQAAVVARTRQLAVLGENLVVGAATRAVEPGDGVILETSGRRM